MLNISSAATIAGERPRVSPDRTYIGYGIAATFAAIVALNLFQPANAQSASGTSNTRCDQTGQSMSCVTTTVFALSAADTLQSGTSLSAFTLSGGASGAPTCSSLVASPQLIPAITSTRVDLTANCQAGATLSWSGVLTQSGSTAQDVLTLVGGGSKTYTLTACSSTQTTLCNVYTVSVTTTATQTPLSGCAITPGSAQLTAGASPNLTVSCSQGGTPTSYSWSVNNTQVSTSSSYAIPSGSTVAGSNLAVSVVLSNGVSPAATASAVYSVAAPAAGACTTSGDVARTINYSDNYIALNDITMGGVGAVYTLGVNVRIGDSSVGKSYLPVWVGTNSPISQNGQRTVSVSLCPNDFNPTSAQIVASGSIDFAVNLTTEKRRVGSGTALVEPGRTYYINVRNETCPKNGTCSLDGQYRNWNQ